MINRVEEFKKITENMADLYERKNSDYGGSFEESVAEFGPIAGVVRISDKFNRLKSLLLKGKDRRVNDESVSDTLTDMACYCIMLKIELDGENQEHN